MSAVPHNSDILEAALEYARQGKPVFPCGGNKKPLVKSGFKAASTDPALIRQWWAKWPDATIGIPTGPVSGLWVLDVDRPKPVIKGQWQGKMTPCGLDTLSGLESQYGKLPDTFTVLTPSNGRHFYFLWPETEAALKNSASQIGQGLDVRGAGGYIIAPPSVINKGPYTICKDVSPVSAPLWLLDLVSKSKAPTQPPQCEISPANGLSKPYGSKALAGEVEAVRLAPIGSRNDTLNTSAYKCGQLVAGGELDEAEATTALTAAAREAGLGQSETAKTLESGLRAGMDTPRSATVHKSTRQELADRINATADFDELTGEIAKAVTLSGLPDSHVLSLRKAIAKKAGVSTKSLEGDAKAFTAVQADATERHLEAARAVIANYGQENILSEPSGFFWVWGKGVWERTDDRTVKQAIHLVAESTELTRNIVASILDLTKTEVFMPNHRFDVNAEAINCLSGELHWTGAEWIEKPHLRENYRTTQIPVVFDPNAKAPRFEQFLSEVFQGDSDAKEKALLINEAIGYTLLSTSRFEKFFMLIGPGANGKSVLMDVVKNLVGLKNTSAVQPSQFENKFQRAHLFCKLLNMVTEIAEGHEIADAELKSIVSGELTTAENKHKPPFEFQPFATCWFGTNHMPRTRDFSDGLFRRTIVIPFNRIFAEHEQDRFLKEKLLLELPGILNLALAGAARILTKNAFTNPLSCQRAAAEWRVNCDQVAQFVESECTWDRDAATPSGELFTAYRRWTTDNGVNRPLAKNSFTNRLCRLGAVQAKGTGGQRLLASIRLSGSGASGASSGIIANGKHICPNNRETIIQTPYGNISKSAPLAPLVDGTDLDSDEARL